MNKTLVIVESPSKAANIQKYLGTNYIVKASFGHIKDLASGGKNGIGVDVNNNFKPKYVINPDKMKVVDELITIAEQCDKILLFSDDDREGESIAYHLNQCLASVGIPTFRGRFIEITKTAIQGAINNVGDIDMNLFRAQEARRILDRIVGFMVSPFLMKYFGNNLSAGRVQSVAVRMIIDREREIEAFKPEEYWNFNIKLSPNNQDSFSAKYEKKLKNKQEAEAVKADLVGADITKSEFVVDKIISKEKKEKPQPPLITGKLQQIMASKFGFPSDKTMKCAQTLYEGGYCTYIRTDSVRASDDAIKSARKWLNENNYETPKSSNVYSAKEAAQDAHECIRPTNINNLPDEIMVNDDERTVYKMIWQYFIASQMTPAVFDTLEVKIKSINNPQHTFKAGGKALKKQGYLAIFGTNADVKIDIPFLNEGDKLFLFGKYPIVFEQKFTQPPARYTEAAILKELETKQIGRPATYAQIIKTITGRNYVEKHGQSYHATELGKQITDVLKKFFPFMEYDYTAELEKQLDDIAAGKLDQLKMMNDFFDPFKKQLNKAYSDYGAELCEKCGSPMIKRTNKQNNNEFLACSSYPSCFYTKNL